MRSSFFQRFVRRPAVPPATQARSENRSCARAVVLVFSIAVSITVISPVHAQMPIAQGQNAQEENAQTPATSPAQSTTSGSSGPDLTTIRELREQRKFAEALKKLDHPDYADSRDAELLRAKLFLDLDRLREAANLYEALCPALNTYDCWNSLGVVRMMLGGYSEAIDAFTRALERSPSSAKAHSNLGMAYAAAFRPAEAGEHHRRAVRLAPSDPVVRINYGAFLYRSREMDEAQEVFEKLARSHGDLFYVRLYLGQIYLARKQYADALRELDIGVQLNDSMFDLYYYRAVARYRTRDPGGALSDLRAADRLEPLNGKTRELRDVIQRSRR